MTTLALPLLAMSMPVIAQYQSVAPPGEHTATPAPDALELLHIDPKNGQTPEREWADRYACNGWATSQSGFDPSKPASGPSDDNTSRRGAYLRAMTACLEARGYSMRDVAPTPYTPPVAAAPPPGWTPVEHASPQRSEFKYHPLVVQIEGGYSLTTGATHQNLDNGSNVGVGVTWFPTSVLPLGLRVDGSYSSFSETPRSPRSLPAQTLRLGTPTCTAGTSMSSSTCKLDRTSRNITLEGSGRIASRPLSNSSPTRAEWAVTFTSASMVTSPSLRP